MAKKKEVHKVGPLNENKKNIISALIQEYDIETAEDIQAALRDLLGGTIKSMMEAEAVKDLFLMLQIRFSRILKIGRNALWMRFIQSFS